MASPLKIPSGAPRCQYSKDCKNPPLDKLPFCQIHKSRGANSIKSQISGAEPNYEPELYNNHNGVKEAQNCFAYAFDYKHLPDNCTKNSCPASFIQPGLKSGYPKWSNVDGKRCPDLMARLLGDVPELIPSTFNEKCPKETSKIAFVVDPDEDYHFYRQDSNGYWSHKPGATDVTNIDARGRPIYNPELASREYPKTGLNYDGFCGYLCVPRGKQLTFKRGGRYNKRLRKTRRARRSRKSKKTRRQ